MTKASRCLFTAAALGLWALAFLGEFGQLARRWSNEDYQHCMLVPLISAYILWQAHGWGWLRASLPRSANWAGPALAAAAGALWILGRAGGLLPLVFVAMYLSLVGLFVILQGWAFVRANAWAFGLLAFAIPGTNLVTHVLTLNLRLASTAIAGWLLPVLGQPVLVEGNILDLGNATLEVADACSGLRYFFPIVYLSFFLGYLLRFRPLGVAALAALSVPVSVLANAARLVAMALIAVHGGRHLLDTWLHEFTGFLLYAVAFGLLLAAAAAIRRLPGTVHPSGAPEPASGNECDATLDARAAGALLALAAAALLVPAWATQRIGEGRPIPPAVPLSGLAMELGEFAAARNLVIDPATLANLGADDYVNRFYQRRGGSEVIYFLMAYYRHQTLDHAVHPPASCQLGSGHTISAGGRRTIDIPGGRPLTFEWSILEKERQRLLTNHFYFHPGGEMTGAVRQRLGVMGANLLGQGSNGGLVRIEMLLGDGQSPEQGQAVLSRFLQSVLPFVRATPAGGQT